MKKILIITILMLSGHAGSILGDNVQVDIQAQGFKRA